MAVDPLVDPINAVCHAAQAAVHAVTNVVVHVCDVRRSVTLPTGR
jgi:hypothetical protein